MGKAEVGSAKHLANKMKSRGLNRLRWYCQLCEKSCRDENGYKMHCQSPSHTAKALEAGSNFKGVQDTFSDQFLKDFVSQLKTSHGEKEIHINKFYQEVIARKDHVHLNATKWHSLTEFAKFLGREGVCRVEEKEGEGIFVAWIDDSPEAMERREKVRRKEMMDKGDEEREMKVLREQIKRAKREAEARGHTFDEEEEARLKERELKRREGEKIKLSFGRPATVAAKKEGERSGEETSVTTTPIPGGGDGSPAAAAEEKNDTTATPPSTTTTTDGITSEPAKVESASKGEEAAAKPTVEESKPAADSTTAASAAAAPKPVSMKFGMKPQPKNVFKNAFAGAPKKVMAAPPKKMSEAERIMKEEMERKRAREEKGGNLPNKKPRFQF
ncbi:domain of Kin17 curved DNA-binding protein-domain-containing protein [Pseudoneurospora amorphoporcata]|uniref:Domain of Kin17 curved DNA-binding protein-domain-containing protein n=1 Tax=Pseudoneurospora amorphoporcata TaxID=241081 RepID=A0AAN6P3H8_9PEZI|nr:domain of Kin17 curved DNA-binding protein-domain-containing protein [Pseudoneurospora amorphoporcata]